MSGEVRVDTPQGPYIFPSQEAADRYLADTKPPVTQQAGSTGKDYGDALKRGVVRGVMTPADMVMMGADNPLGAGGIPFVIKKLLERGGIENFDPGKRVLDATGIEKPKGTGAKYAEEITAGGVGGVLMGGRPSTSLISGMSGGAGGQLAADLTSDNPISRVIGALLGGLLGYGGYSAIMGSRAKTRVNDLAKDIPDSTFDKIREGVENAKDKGITVSAAQGTAERTPLSVLTQEVAGSPKSGPKQMVDLEKQGGQAKGAADKLLGMLGAPEEPAAAAHGAQKAATQAIDAADKSLTKAVTPFYATDKGKMAEFGERIQELARRIVAGADKATEHGKALEDLSETIKKVETPEQLNSVYHEWNQGLKAKQLNNKPIVDYTAGEIRKKGLAHIDEMLENLQVDRKGGKALYKKTTDEVIDPLRRSPTGQIAGAKGVVEDVPTATNRVLGVLDDKNIRAQTILETQATLDKQGPGTFARVARAAFEKKLEAAFTPVEGQTPFDAPAKLAKAVWGGEHQTAARENFRATMAGVARSHGLTGAAEGQFVKGAEKIMQAIEAAGREKPVGSVSHPAPIAGEIVKGAGAAALYAPQATGILSRTVERLSGGKMAKDLYDLLWSGPEGVDKIRKIARMSIPEIRAGAAAGTFTSAVQQAEE